MNDPRDHVYSDFYSSFHPIFSSAQFFGPFKYRVVVLVICLLWSYVSNKYIV
jgi:hypothetical protein